MGNLHSLQHLLDLHEPMVCHYRISFPCECWRMMCPKPLEATRTSLATYCTSLCNSNSRNTYSLNKGLLVKYWWRLTSTPWTTSTSSPSTSHLHNSNGKLISNTVSPRRKHSPETLFTYRKIFHTQCPCIHRNFKTIIQYIKSKSTTKILF